MTVYVVLTEHWYESSDVFGVFKTRESAVRAIKIEIESHGCKFLQNGDSWDCRGEQTSLAIYPQELEE